MTDYYTYERNRRSPRQGTRAEIDELIVKPIIATDGAERKGYLAIAIALALACLLPWALGAMRALGWW